MQTTSLYLLWCSMHLNLAHDVFLRSTMVFKIPMCHESAESANYDFGEIQSSNEALASFLILGTAQKRPWLTAEDNPHRSPLESFNGYSFRLEAEDKLTWHLAGDESYRAGRRVWGTDSPQSWNFSNMASTWLAVTMAFEGPAAYPQHLDIWANILAPAVMTS
ncbi:hypothetical protein IWX49DRAFT_142954 [Phyllosticta citricarpa]|uniref:Uncharacterized protein n=1 Tax=Phyllosticta paracitricarpa TaxID=2016321 RepID=A0ABR1NAK7_9PEZI